MLKREKFFWKLIFFVYIVLLTYFSVSKPVVNYSNFVGEDKLIHLGTYFLLSDFFMMAFSKGKKLLFCLFLSLILILPVANEYFQSLTKWHVLDYKDAIAGYLGIILGIGFFEVKNYVFNLYRGDE